MGKGGGGRAPPLDLGPSDPGTWRGERSTPHTLGIARGGGREGGEGGGRRGGGGGGQLIPLNRVGQLLHRDRYNSANCENRCDRTNAILGPSWLDNDRCLQSRNLQMFRLHSALTKCMICPCCAGRRAG